MCHVMFRGLPCPAESVHICLWHNLIMSSASFKAMGPVLRRISSKVCQWFLWVSVTPPLWERCHRLFLLGQHVLLSKAQTKKKKSTCRRQGDFTSVVYIPFVYTSALHSTPAQKAIPYCRYWTGDCFNNQIYINIY